MIAAMQTKGHGRGKSGLRRAGCQITSGGGDSQDSATEIYRVSNEADGMRRMPRNEEGLPSE